MLQNRLEETSSRLEIANNRLEKVSKKLDKLINSIAWFIPIKKWRDSFRKKFE